MIKSIEVNVTTGERTETLMTQQEEAAALASAAQYAIDAPKIAIRQQIAALEAQVTNRRIREAIRGQGKAWLDNIDDQIAALRAQLPV